MLRVAHGLGDSQGTHVLLHRPARLGQRVRESSRVYRRIELSVDGAEDLELLVLVEPCSGAPTRIEGAVPLDIGRAISRPPTDGSMVDIGDSEEAAQGSSSRG